MQPPLSGEPHGAKGSPLIVTTSNRLYADPPTHTQGHRIDRREAAIEFEAVIGHRAAEDDEEVDVAFSTGVAPRLGSEENHGVEPVAVGDGEPLLHVVEEILERPDNLHDAFL